MPLHYLWTTCSARNPTPKTLGTRHDPGYLQQPTRFGSWRRRLAYGIPALVVAFLVLPAASPFKSKQVLYSKGPLSSAHAFIAEKCELCHSATVNGQTKVGWMQKASDQACMACHQ